MEINTFAQSVAFTPVTGFSRPLSGQEKPAQVAIVEQTPGQKLEQKVTERVNADGLSPAAAGESTANSATQKDADSDNAALRDPTQPTSPTGEALSEAELREIEQLKRRDAEVRAHEQAHMGAAGNLVRSGASFDYETGPDGKRYAVGGEVTIDTSKVSGDPQATLIKAQKIRRAASAPADPSPQDRSVAAEASRMEAQARVEISQQARTKQNEYIDENTPEIDFLSGKIAQNEQDIENTYRRIQNTQVLEQQRIVVDFYI